MYVWWGIEFLINTVIIEPLSFAMELVSLIIDVVGHLINLVGAFPLWLSVPFGCLLAIAVLFRISQFIPSLGGAS